jgi:hypothetical protein
LSIYFYSVSHLLRTSFWALAFAILSTILVCYVVGLFSLTNLRDVIMTVVVVGLLGSNVRPLQRLCRVAPAESRVDHRGS